MSTKPFVLAVDDEAGILRLLKLELEDHDFTVVTASGGEEAIRMAEEQRPDVILLDIMMPDVGGLEVMRRLREQIDAPVILVTAKDADKDKVRGLELGADDYVVKPFNPDELAARIRAVLRHQGQQMVRIVRHDGLEIDLDRCIVKRDGKQLSITRTEWVLLEVLASNAGRVMTNPELLGKVWGAEYTYDVQYLRVWISRLRHKLEREPSSPSLITTVPGIGYVLNAKVEEPAVPSAAAS